MRQRYRCDKSPPGLRQTTDEAAKSECDSRDIIREVFWEQIQHISVYTVGSADLKKPHCATLAGQWVQVFAMTGTRLLLTYPQSYR